MRIGILGMGPAALLLAQKIIRLGVRPLLLGESRRNESFLARQPILQGVWEEVTAGADVYFPVDILRYGKKFLRQSEEVAGHSRLIDLFQITYLRNLAPDQQQQILHNQVLRQSFGPDLTATLAEPFEEAQEVDILVDTRGWWDSPGHLGVRGLAAINESKWKSEIFYDLSWMELAEVPATLTVVLASEFVSLFTEWVVTHWPKFKRINIIKADQVDCSVLAAREQQHWQEQIVQFEEQIKKWKALDNHERAKIARPQEPQHKVLFWDNFVVQSVDKLLDRQEFFVTIEHPAFYGKEELKTISSDGVIALQPRERGVQEEEIGQFYLTQSYLCGGSLAEQELQGQVDQTLEQILHFFSPRSESET